MCANRVRNLLNSDRGDHFGIGSGFQESLREQIVVIGFNKRWNVADNSEDIKLALGNGLIGQVHIMQIESEEVVGHNAHLLICLHIKDVVGVHVVESFVEGFGDLNFQVHNCIEDPNFLELHQFDQIRHLLFVRVHSV